MVWCVTTGGRAAISEMRMESSAARAESCEGRPDGVSACVESAARAPRRLCCAFALGAASAVSTRTAIASGAIDRRTPTRRREVHVGSSVPGIGFAPRVSKCICRFRESGQDGQQTCQPRYAVGLPNADKSSKIVEFAKHSVREVPRSENGEGDRRDGQRKNPVARPERELPGQAASRGVFRYVWCVGFGERVE